MEPSYLHNTSNPKANQNMSVQYARVYVCEEPSKLLPREMVINGSVGLEDWREVGLMAGRSVLDISNFSN
jgi:hypothetical protein